MTNIYELHLPLVHFNCGILFTRREGGVNKESTCVMFS